MATKTASDQSTVLATLDEIRQELKQLSARIATLEAAQTVAAKPPAPVAERISDETVLAISAVLAAHLGCRPHIRQISLTGGASWAHDGRATIQASHRLATRHE